MRGRDKGLRRVRGRADVIYQCHELVPQAEAPRLESDGKMLERKAENSGQRGPDDCQKKVSIGTERRRAMEAPMMPAGSRALRINAICD